MLFPDLGDALISLTEDTPDDVGEWPANHAHGSLPGCRGHLANHRAREGGKKRRTGVPEPKCRQMVRAVKCGGDPTQPTYHHHTSGVTADVMRLAINGGTVEGSSRISSSRNMGGHVCVRSERLTHPSHVTTTRQKKREETERGFVFPLFPLWFPLRVRQCHHRTALRTVDTHRRNMKAEAVVGTTAGSQRSGTKSTASWKCTNCGEGNFLDETRGRSCTLGNFCKNSGQREKQPRQKQRSVREPTSHQKYATRKDESRNTRKTSSSRKTDRRNGRRRTHIRVLWDTTKQSHNNSWKNSKG